MGKSWDKVLPPIDIWKECLRVLKPGGFSRFFDIDKWDAENGFTGAKTSTLPFMIVPKASKSEKNAGCEQIPERSMEYDTKNRLNKETADKFGGERKSIGSNHHSTVKPTKLFRYLISLGSRKGDVILDPFMGSGTTGVAAIETDRDFIGIELDKDYYDICKARIKHAKEPNGQPGLF